jgi:DMSO/TMAO reductase YedYZ molybdopterin-dependent catalytic subunit
VRAGARQVTFNGVDNPPVGTIPDFVKALDIDHARDGEVLVAFAMNGADLPSSTAIRCAWWCRAITAPYWVKHLSEINVVDAEYDGTG